MLRLSPGITAYILSVAALLGLCMGSFVNCMAFRLARGEGFIKGRSQCPACGHALGALDLVPLFSYLFLKGRCRYCGARISARYPLTELLSALYFVSIPLVYGVTPKMAALLLLGLILLAVSLVDLDTGLIPDRFILGGIGLFLLSCLFEKPILPALWQGLLGGLTAAVPLTGIVLAADRLMGRETMGGGDIKLFFMAGLFLDWKRSILFLIFSCIFGIIFAGLAKKRRGVEFPFGPAIAAGAWAVLLFGQAVLSWYLGLF